MEFNTMVNVGGFPVRAYILFLNEAIRSPTSLVIIGESFKVDTALVGL